MIQYLYRYTQVGQKEVVYIRRFTSLKDHIHSDTCLLRLQLVLVVDALFWVQICVLVTMIDSIVSEVQWLFDSVVSEVQWLFDSVVLEVQRFQWLTISVILEIDDWVLVIFEIDDWVSVIGWCKCIWWLYYSGNLFWASMLLMGLVWKFDETWPSYCSNVYQEYPVWKVMKFGPSMILRVGAFSEEVEASCQ